MKETKTNGVHLPLAAKIVLPLLVTVFCSGILLLCGIRPYEAAKTYLRIAFMDGSGSVSDGSTAGLNIVETNIDTSYDRETSAEGEAVIPVYGSQCAILECKDIDLYVPVYWGSGYELLEQGACQAPASAALGSSGNSVISAHVNTFFRDLNQLEIGDTVTAYTTYGRFTYEVSELIEFDASNKSYIGQKDRDILTLYTCELQLFGSSSKRVGAVCKLTEKAFYSAEEDSGNA